MSKPVILCVDDDPEVLAVVERDLRKHYRSDYRIVRASSGAEGIDAVRKLKERGTPIGLLLADYRMPKMSGTEFLLEAIKLYPEACRVLLTAYADTEAAITSINDIGLDHYLLKPWDPPEDRLFPVLDDLLGGWHARFKPPFEGVRVAGAAWSALSYDTKEWLSRNNVPYEWVDIDRDPGMRELCESICTDIKQLPVVFFTDGSHLVAPSHSELADKLGIQTHAKRPFYDLVIMGGGPAGLGAAVYAASEGLSTVLIEEKAPGGQAGTSSRIENYLGFPNGLSGADLALRAVTQAKRFGAELITTQEVTGIRREDPYRIVTLSDGTDISCKALLIATGVAVRELDAPGISEFTGVGVFYGAALTEAASIRGQHVVVVGGANSAGQGAVFFSRFASKVTVVIRGESLDAGMSRYLVDRIEADPKIEVLTRSAIDHVRGNQHLETVCVRNLDSGEESEIQTPALFIFIGAQTRTGMVSELIALDEQDYVLTGPDIPRNDQGIIPGWHLDRQPFLFETSVPGIFAAGDVRSGSGKRVATSVGEGSATVSMIHRYLQYV